MLRYVTEPRLRRQLTSIQLTLRHESVGNGHHNLYSEMAQLSSDYLKTTASSENEAVVNKVKGISFDVRSADAACVRQCP